MHAVQALLSLYARVMNLRLLHAGQRCAATVWPGTTGATAGSRGRVRPQVTPSELVNRNLSELGAMCVVKASTTASSKNLRPFLNGIQRAAGG